LTRLALFPLPVVLLPGTPLPLHIFELRYRAMVARCREESKPFGLIYHDPDLQGPFLLEEGRVGTEAHIEVFHGLPDGRSLILVRGGERFSIRDGIESDEPYYQAVVESYLDRPQPAAAIDLLPGRRRRSSELLRRAVEAVGGAVEGIPELDAAGDVSFQLARCLQINPAWLQALLELKDESARLERLDVIFRAAVEGRGRGALPPESGEQP
jgi:Lon protease-like protein